LSENIEKKTNKNYYFLEQNLNYTVQVWRLVVVICNYYIRLTAAHLLYCYAWFFLLKSWYHPTIKFTAIKYTKYRK
jgi:hypothetical protein